MNSNQYIKKRRIAMGLTINDVAKYVGVSGATVSRWENGVIANMKRDKLKKLAEVLHTSPIALMNNLDGPLESESQHPSADNTTTALSRTDRPELEKLMERLSTLDESQLRKAADYLDFILNWLDGKDSVNGKGK